ncbi:hypothetical protein M440DRAFT_1400212 [Trichoderma longibrachiatum ATCC 18648]|uniref:Uncharacterized protein n=1 Tax=Trichoderma longibrachiatum ATCC 18648 TaxID=983965 RepID=A0A2T4C6Z8_TRILO|nr:hypothetical protein M440DRAFT_1400212 [Trichoderma longibrachiatum ATCC 18648]
MGRIDRGVRVCMSLVGVVGSFSLARRFFAAMAWHGMAMGMGLYHPIPIPPVPVLHPPSDPQI